MFSIPVKNTTSIEIRPLLKVILVSRLLIYTDMFRRDWSCSMTELHLHLLQLNLDAQNS